MGKFVTGQFASIIIQCPQNPAVEAQGDVEAQKVLGRCWGQKVLGRKDPWSGSKVSGKHTFEQNEA